MATRTLPHIIDPAMSSPPYSLKGADLDVFADLWYYSRNKPFNGSYQHLADWIEVPKTTLIRSIRYLEQKGLVDVISINAHRTSFQAKALEGHPLPVYQFHCIGLVGQNGVILNQDGPKTDQNGPYNNNIYNTNPNKKTYKRENLNNGIVTSGDLINEAKNKIERTNDKLNAFNFMIKIFLFFKNADISFVYL